MKNLKYFLAQQMILLQGLWPKGSRSCIFDKKKIDEYTDYVGKLGAKGLAYIKVVDLDQENGLQSPILKFFQQETIDSNSFLYKCAE